MNLFGKLRDFLAYPTHRRTMGIVIMLVLAAAVSLTVVLSQQQQTIRQRASELTEKGYALCGSGFGFRQCQNDITVSASCDEGKNKCLSTTANFSGADRINGKSLTCCLSDQYRNVDNKCTLVAKDHLSSSDENCSPPMEPQAKSYASCGSDLDCENNIAVDSDCPTTEYSKCLSSTNFSGDKIDGRSLTCCKAREYKRTGKNDECTLVENGTHSNPECTDELTRKSFKCTTYGYAKNDKCEGEAASTTVTYHLLSSDSKSVQCAPLMDPLDNGDTWYSKTDCVESPSATSTDSASPVNSVTAGTPTLTIDNNPESTVDHKGDLSYSFTRFQPGNIDVWVTKRGQNERTGDIANATAGDNGSGNSTILGLTELAGEYTLWAKGSNGVSANADFTVKPTLKITNPDSTIQHGKDLNFEFKGFGLNEQVTVGVVGGGSIVPITAANGAGNGSICCLTESANTYALKATGTSGHFATADFTVTNASGLWVGALVFVDVDGNGEKDEGEKAPDGTTTVIITSLDGKWNDSRTMTNGNWNSVAFILPKEGDYKLQINVSSKYTPRNFYRDISINAENPGKTISFPVPSDSTQPPAPGDTVIQLPDGAFATLFTDTKKATPELITSKDQSLTIYLYESTVDPKDDLQGENAIKKTHENKLSPESEDFSFNLGNVTPGTYKILLKSPKYLRTTVDTKTISATGGIITLTLSKSLTEGIGDVNGDNVLDITDYNAILGCAGTNIFTEDWCNTDANKLAADINDDGEVNGVDLSIFTRSLNFSRRQGD